MNELTKTKTSKEIYPVLCTFPVTAVNSESIVVIGHKNLLFSLECLKYHVNNQYKLLSCISGVDLIECYYRFCVVYDLLSLVHSSRLRVKVFVNEITSIDSLVNIYINSD